MRRIQVDATMERRGAFHVPLLMLQHYSNEQLQDAYRRQVKSRRRVVLFYLNAAATGVRRDQVIALMQRMLKERGIEP